MQLNIIDIVKKTPLNLGSFPQDRASVNFRFATPSNEPITPLSPLVPTSSSDVQGSLEGPRSASPVKLKDDHSVNHRLLWNLTERTMQAQNRI